MIQIRQVAVIGALVAATLAMLILILTRNRPALAGLRSWGLGLAAMTAGLVVHATRGLGVPELASVVVGNGLLFIALLLSHRSVCLIIGNGDRDALGWWMAGLAVLGLVILFHTVEDIRPRGVLISGVAAAFLVRAGMTLQLGSSRGLMRGRLLASNIFYVWAALHLVRAVYYAGSPPWEVFLHADAMTAATFLPTLLLALVGTFAIVWMQLTSPGVDPEVRGIGAQSSPAYPGDPVLNWLLEFRATQPIDEAIKTRVCLVDGSAEFLAKAEAILQLAGYAVRTASSADDALRLISDQLVKPHVTVTASVMPGRLSGAGLARRLAAEYPRMGIIVLSSDSRSARLSDGRVISERKPEALDALVRMIEKAKSSE